MDKKSKKEYYKNCPFPTPEGKKKRKKQNGWKDKPERVCRYTGTPGAERHELFYGEPYRQISIDHGFQVDLHWAIHKLFHGIVDKEGLKGMQVPGMFPDPIAWAKKEQQELREDAQEKYEMRDQIELGLTPEEAREKWIEMMGRNYIDD